MKQQMDRYRRAVAFRIGVQGLVLFSLLLLQGADLKAQTFQFITALQSIPVTAITGEKPQSKVWTYDGYWWAVMPNSTGSWLWRLDGSTWTAILQLSLDTDTHADVKSVGPIAHILLYRGTSSRLVSVEYVAASDTYQLWTARPATVNFSLDGGIETATIDIDGNGRMWLASDASTDINVRWSDAPYASWSAPITIASGINSDDISVITSFPNGSVGVLWSNQNTRRFGFKVHVAGDAPASWSADEVPASQSALNVGAGMADDHLNVAVASDGTLYAAVKTSYDTGGYPKIAFLVRRPNATWDNLYEVDGSGTRAICLLNEAAGIVTVIYTSSEGAGNILYKQSYLSPISFGTSHTLIAGAYNDATSTRQNIGNEVAILASNGSVAVGALAYSTPVATHTITASAGPNGSISPSGAVVVSDGANQTFTITPAGGYAVANVTVDGGSIGAVTSYTFFNVTANHSISATFAVDNQPPGQPILVAPPDHATGVTLSPLLQATVSDPNGDPLTVAFYGRPVVASPPADFTIVMLPDTQFYSAAANGGSPAIFYSQTSWIVANRLARNIAYVGHSGDCVNTADVLLEWQHADTALTILDSAAMRWGITPGNHDQDPNGNPDGASTALFNQFFGVSRFEGQPQYGGHYGANNDNHFDLFSAGGLDFIAIFFEYNLSPDQAVLDWADSLLSAYSTRRAIAISHNTINLGNPGPYSTQGQAIYDALKNHPNFFLALGSHWHGEGQRMDVFNGDTVYALVADYQDRPHGGDGWLRLLEFSPLNNRIQVRTYSPWLDQFETDGDSEFQLSYDMTTPLAGAVAYRPRETGESLAVSSGTEVAVDTFTLIGTNSGVSSGTTTGIIWPDLMPSSDYEWYVTVSDGATLTTGPVWSFTTTGDTPPLIVSTPVTTATVGSLYTYDVDATGSPAPTYAIVAAPAGMAIHPVTGVIQWTPATSGPTSITVSATNAAGSDLQSFTIQVGQVPQITTAPVTAGVVGQLYSYDVDATGSPTPTYSLLDSPAGMAADPVSGLIQWVPQSDGNFNVAVRAANTSGSDTQSYSIEVINVPAAPLLIDPAHMAVTNDATPSFVWSSTAGPGGSYTLQYAMNALFTTGLVAVAAVGESTYTVSPGSALADGVWFWHVQAVSSTGDSGAYQSTPFYFTLDTQAPQAPALVLPANAALIADDSPTFVWRNTAGAGGSYTLEYALDAAFTTGKVTIVSGAETTYTVAAPQPALADGDYYWHARATDAAGNVGLFQATPYSFTVSTAAPEVPVLFSPANLAVTSDNTPTLEWTATAGPGGTYTLQYSTDPTLVAALTVDALTVPAYTIPVPMANGTYYWHVKARNSLGIESSYQIAPFRFTVNNSPLAVPALLLPGNLTSTTATMPTLEWRSVQAGVANLVQGAGQLEAVLATVSYTLAFGTDSTFGQAITLSSLMDTSFTIPESLALDAGLWFWHVEAVDDGGRHSGFQPSPFRFGVFISGDQNGDGLATSADIILLVNFVFKGGVSPIPCQAAGDVNCDGAVTAADIIYMVNYVFKGGPAACDVGELITDGVWSCP